MVRFGLFSRARLCVVLLAALSVATANPEATTVFGGSYVLRAGETRATDLTAIGAAVTFEPGSRLDGHLTVIGGSATIGGRITQDVHAYGGALRLGAGSRVDGDVGTYWAAFDRHPGATVGGALDQGARRAVRFDFPAVPTVAVDAFARGATGDSFAETLARALALAAFAALLVVAAPTQIDRVRTAMVEQTGRAAITGLATLAIAIIALVMAALTLVGIPIAVFGALLIALAVGIGMVALSVHAGRAIEAWAGQRWAPWQSAAIGAFVVVLVLQGLGYMPAIGGVATFVVSAIAIGALVVTRGGTRADPGRAVAAVPSATPSV
jgi:hypothetical protein